MADGPTGPDLRTAAERWHLTERGALLYGDDSGGITVAGLAAWQDSPERTEAIRALSRWCDDAIASAAALAAEATERPPAALADLTQRLDLATEHADGGATLLLALHFPGLDPDAYETDDLADTVAQCVADHGAQVEVSGIPVPQWLSPGAVAAVRELLALPAASGSAPSLCEGLTGRIPDRERPGEYLAAYSSIPLPPGTAVEVREKRP